MLVLLFAIRQVAAGRAPAVEPAENHTANISRGTALSQLDAAPPPSDPAAGSPPAPRIQFSVSPIEPNYVVTGGDTLSAIAQRYNASVDVIAAINNLPDRSVTLHVGQRLVIPR